MKLTFGVLAVLLFATTLAVSQPANLPFPQAANPALQSGDTIVPLVVAQDYDANVPSSMAANESGMSEQEAPSVLAWHNHNSGGLGSPFPSAANPSLHKTGEEMSSSGRIETGSPFPQAANPARDEW